MFNFKSQLLGVAAVLPIAAAGLLGSASSAQAYTGSFNYTAAPLQLGSPSTTATISNSFINFTPSPGAVSLSLQTGDFVGDNAGYIYSLQTLLGTLSPSPQQFIDIIDVTAPINAKVLSLTSIFAPVFTSQATGGTGTDINLTYNGIFEDGTLATGYMTFATQENITNAQTKYNNGTGFQATFTGLAVTTVPEPTTILGLGLVGAGMFAARRRKLVKA